MTEVSIHNVKSIVLESARRLGNGGNEFYTRELVITDSDGRILKVVLYSYDEDNIRVAM